MLGAVSFAVFAVVGCAQRVSVSIAAPVELAGAEILIDGDAVGRLEAVRAGPNDTRGLNETVEGATAMISVLPGSHEFRIVKPGLKPITRTLRYERPGEDYIAIEYGEVSAVKAEPTR